MPQDVRQRPRFSFNERFLRLCEKSWPEYYDGHRLVCEDGDLTPKTGISDGETLLSC